MKQVCVVVMCAVGIFLTSHTHAQTPSYSLQTLGVLNETDNSITKVMQRAGCDFNWLSQVIADSNINPANLRRLPVGQPVVLQSGLCKTTPPQNVTNLSRVIFSIDSGTRVVTINFEEQLRELEKSRDTILAANTRLQNQVKELTGAKTKAEEELASTKAALAKAGGVNPIYALILVLIGILVGAGSLYFKVRDDRKSVVTHPKEITVTEDGNTHVFTLAGSTQEIEGGEVIPKYKCPLCTEKNISIHNVQRHLLNNHLGAKPEVVGAQAAHSTTTTTRVTRSERNTSIAG